MMIKRRTLSLTGLAQLRDELAERRTPRELRDSFRIARHPSGIVQRWVTTAD
jgi:hypothetical protein